MKWTDGLKEQLKELAFAEKSNKEIAEIMDIPLKEVHAGRSRFGLTIAKVKAMKGNEPQVRTKQDIKTEIKEVRETIKETRKAAHEKIQECYESIKVLEEELFEKELVEIARS